MKWYQRLLQYPEVWLLSFLAFLTRLWQVGSPPAIVFDEVYFRAFASNYLSGNYFFDIHPPFAKLLFAGIASLFGLSAEQIVSGEASSVLLRIFPAIAGASLIPLVYVIIRQLGLGRRFAFLGGSLLLFDNAFLVESRFVLMDSTLLLVGLGAISIFLKLRKHENKNRWAWVLILGLLLGVLVSIKWTGIAIVALLAIAWTIDASLKHPNKKRKTILEALSVIVLIFTVYIGGFWVHFSLLSRSGEGDVFMSRNFQSTLIGSQFYNENKQITFIDKFLELNGQMYNAQNSLKNTTHPYSSRWYSWPIMFRPVYFWQSDIKADGSQAHIYLLGNPIVWWLGLIGMIGAFGLLSVKPSWLGKKTKLFVFLLGGYVINFVPFMFIDRPMFLYHYLFALIFSLLAACVLLDVIFDGLVSKRQKKLTEYIYWGIIAAVFGAFLFFLPLSYGWYLSPDGLLWHMWLPSWR